LLLALLLAGCTHETTEGTPLGVTLQDFKITTAQQTVAAGHVVFDVHNDAPMTHEFVLVRSNLPADELPIGPDGLSVNEDWLSGVGELGEVPPRRPAPSRSIWSRAGTSSSATSRATTSAGCTGCSR
jgi:hypothetical protein